MVRSGGIYSHYENKLLSISLRNILDWVEVEDSSQMCVTLFRGWGDQTE